MADVASQPPLTAGAAEHPVMVDLNAPLEVARWRPLVHWLLAIPHFFVMSALNFLTGVLTFIAFFAILFTKKYPEPMFNLVVMAYRYQWRVNSYVLFMRESYPPFEFDAVANDPGTDPAVFTIPYPNELNRWLPLVKVLLAIPHFFVLMFLMFGAFFAWIGAFFGVLFTGKYPEGIRGFMVGVVRYQFRVMSYVALLRDEYPPFGIK